MNELIFIGVRQPIIETPVASTTTAIVSMRKRGIVDKQILALPQYRPYGMKAVRDPLVRHQARRPSEERVEDGNDLYFTSVTLESCTKLVVTNVKTA